MSPNPPRTWLLRLEAKACCSTCGAWSPLHGPDPELTCRLCAQRTPLSDDLWNRALSEALAVGYAWERGHADSTLYRFDEDADPELAERLQCNVQKELPACPSCRRDLEADALAHDDSACPGCGFLLPVQALKGGSPSPRLRWVLRVPHDPELDAQLAEFEQHALDAKPASGTYDRDWLPEALRAGEHVHFGVCWLVLQVDDQALEATRQRVTDALTHTDAALDAAGIVPELPYEQVIERARAEEEEDDDWSEEDDDDEYDDDGRDAAVGCALVSGIATMGMVAGVLLVLAVIAVLLFIVALLLIG